MSWVDYAHRLADDSQCDWPSSPHERNAYLFVDAIQALGESAGRAAHACRFSGGGDGHKWMLGPEGAGLLFVRREHLDLLRPLGLGWNSVRQGNDYSRIELNVKDSAALLTKEEVITSPASWDWGRAWNCSGGMRPKRWRREFSP